MIDTNKLGVKLMLAAQIVLILAYNLWPIFGSKIYYTGIALSFPILFITITLLLKPKDVFSLSACFICIWLSMTNLLDELFFDPKKIEISEYAYSFGGCLLITYLINKYWGNAIDR